MTVMVMIPLDDLTEENGATSVKPGSQLTAEYPTNVEEYRSKSSLFKFSEN
jgi:ectoine hydroxylase-related dioxygenase (phytanoyl-CoA dioxygenase family)